MELIEKLLRQIEAPLTFVTENNYDRLSLVKNLDVVITGLSQQLLNEISLDSDIHDPQWGEIGRLSESLAKLFEVYDRLSLEQRKEHVAKAIQRVAELKAIVKIFSSIPVSGERPTERKIAEKADELLSRSVRSIRGVGPHIAELLGKMNLFTIEDMLYYLPRQYEDRREICRIPDTVPGVR